jgi:hypothetical protein
MKTDPSSADETPADCMHGLRGHTARQAAFFRLRRGEHARLEQVFCSVLPLLAPAAL